MSQSLIECDIGDRVIVRGTLTDEAGDPVEGASVTARTLHADEETDLGAATDEGSGVYSVTVEPDDHGKWTVRFDAADPTLAAEEGTIWVRRSGFSPLT